LREQEDALLARLDEAHGELAERRGEYVGSVSARRSLLDAAVAEIEKKRDQPDMEFLMGSRPCRCLPSCEAAKAPLPEPVPSALRRRVCSLSETSELVLGALAEFRGKAKQRRGLAAAPDSKVTLDPETANPYLVLSNDGKTLRLGKRHQDLPDAPGRFTGSSSVLGTQG
ncbi:TRIM7 ligase, partial [Dromaius novaehollandiae]|nr:TRIM7 ligase [Dromaius novaehollandiae]